MDAQLSLSQGELEETLAQLQDTGRIYPSTVKHRVFLFQLLALMGQWDRALTQLNVAGELDAGRLRRFRKLQSEDRRNTETLAERRSRDKNFGKMIKSVLSDKRKERGGKHGGN